MLQCTIVDIVQSLCGFTPVSGSKNNALKPIYCEASFTVRYLCPVCCKVSCAARPCICRGLGLVFLDIE